MHVRSTSPTVAVVIACRNGREFLPESLSSVEAQTRPAHERILVDDGSSDGSGDYARSRGWRVLATAGTVERGAGPSIARNVGVRAATTDLVAFLDADDQWTPEHLARSVALLEILPSVVLVFSANDRRSVPGTPGLAEGSAIDAEPLLMQANPVPLSAVVARHEALLRAGLFPENRRLAEDYDLWARLSAVGHFAFTGETSVTYRVHPGQASHRYCELGLAGLEVRLAHIDRCRQRQGGELDGLLARIAEEGVRNAIDSLWQMRCRGAYRRGVALARSAQLGFQPRAHLLRTAALTVRDLIRR